MLLDARSETAFAQGHIDGAINLPLPDFTAERLAEVLGPDKDRPVYSSGARDEKNFIEPGTFLFKAELGAVSAQVAQVQGVWVAPAHRGLGLSVAGMAAVVDRALGTVAPLVSLYVNDHNVRARAAYARVGFREVGTYANVLF